MSTLPLVNCHLCGRKPAWKVEHRSGGCMIQLSCSAPEEFQPHALVSAIYPDFETVKTEVYSMWNHMQESVQEVKP